MIQKQEIRKFYKQLRNDMEREQVAALSFEICKHILESPLFQTAEYIYAYYPLGNEADIRPVIEEAWKQGKRVAFPKVFGDEMSYFEIDAFSQLKEGAFGVMEPIAAETGVVTKIADECRKTKNVGECRKMKSADARVETKLANSVRMTRADDWQGKDTLVLTPGVAFDRHGNRMGFGKGYYDRHFAKMNRYIMLGVAYELQMAEELPTSEFDVALPYIVTECGIAEYGISIRNKT